MKAEERHKLKHDKYAETVYSGWSWARVHTAPIVIGIVAILVIIIGVTWLVNTRRQAHQTALELLSDAQMTAAKAVGVKENREQAVKEAIDSYDRLARQYDDDASVASRALFEAGQLLLDTDQPEKAVGYFERALGKAGKERGLVNQSRSALAVALEKTGKHEAAIKHLSVFLKEGRSPLAVQACWDIGRNYEAMGKKDEALENYRKAADLGGETTWAKLARARIMSLTATEPKVAPEPRVPDLLRRHDELTATTLPGATTTTVAGVTTTTQAGQATTTTAPAAAPTTTVPVVPDTTAPAAQ